MALPCRRLTVCGDDGVRTGSRNGSFDPQCLTPLVRLLEPRALVRSHVVHWHARAVGVRKTAWLLEGEGEEGWMIKEISCLLGSNFSVFFCALSAAWKVIPEYMN